MIKKVAHAYCDGSGGSPRGSSCGCVVVDPVSGQVLAEKARPLPVGTNNVAEYRGLILALETARDLKITNLHIFSDSKLIVEQINEKWDVKDHVLRRLREEAWKIGEYFFYLELTWIPREKNKLADKLCRECLNDNNFRATPAESGRQPSKKKARSTYTRIVRGDKDPASKV